MHDFLSQQYLDHKRNFAEPNEHELVRVDVHDVTHIGTVPEAMVIKHEAPKQHTPATCVLMLAVRKG